jgi:glycosyltransferase involved in cell wall biosynthesis
MRVGFLTSWSERCGIAEYSRLLAEALRRHVEVEIVPATFQPSPRAVYAAMGRALAVGEIAHIQHAYAFFGGLHPVRCGWSALLAEVRRPLMVTIHELDLRATGAYHLPAPLEQLYKRRFNRAAFTHPRIRHRMVHSPELERELRSLGASPEALEYAPLPLAPPPAAPDRDELVRKLGLSGRRVLVILGFLARRKGYDLALRALAQLPPEFVLVAAGGEHAADRSGTAEWLRAEAVRMGVTDRFRVTGYLGEEELEQVAARADLVLAPFLEMSASASLNFALARGKAVIASDLPPNRLLDCVRLVPTGDADALAAAIRELSSSAAAASALSDRALAYASRHSYEALADLTVRRYEELLRRP